jgi:hypothetical protein
MPLPTDLASISEHSEYVPDRSIVIEDIQDNREAMNRILAEANVSPIRSQARKTLERQSKSGLRRLLSKFNRGTRSFEGIF